MKVLKLALAMALLSGCSIQTFTVNGQSEATPTVDQWEHFFIEGIAQEQVIDAAATCGGVEKVGKVESRLTFLNGLVRALTFGIYAPRTTRVYCTRG